MPNLPNRQRFQPFTQEFETGNYEIMVPFGARKIEMNIVGGGCGGAANLTGGRGGCSGGWVLWSEPVRPDDWGKMFLLEVGAGGAGAPNTADANGTSGGATRFTGFGFTITINNTTVTSTTRNAGGGAPSAGGVGTYSGAPIPTGFHYKGSHDKIWEVGLVSSVPGGSGVGTDGAASRFAADYPGGTGGDTTPTDGQPGTRYGAGGGGGGGNGAVRGAGGNGASGFASIAWS